MDDRPTGTHRPDLPAHQDVAVWLRAIGRELGEVDVDGAACALRAVLTALRYHLSPDAAARLAVHLPDSVRSSIIPDDAPPTAAYTRRSFMTVVADEMGSEGAHEPESVTYAVIKVMGQQVAPKDADALRRLLPADLRGLWPEQSASSTNGARYGSSVARDS